jgi:hypothetical protein
MFEACLELLQDLQYIWSEPNSSPPRAVATIWSAVKSLEGCAFLL